MISQGKVEVSILQVLHAVRVPGSANGHAACLASAESTGAISHLFSEGFQLDFCIGFCLASVKPLPPKESLGDPRHWQLLGWVCGLICGLKFLVLGAPGDAAPLGGEACSLGNPTQSEPEHRGTLML